MQYSPDFELAFLLRFLCCTFLPQLFLSRVLLFAAGRYRWNGLVIFLTHVATFFAVQWIGPALEARLLPNKMFFLTLTNGGVLWMQLCLTVADFVQMAMVRRGMGPNDALPAQTLISRSAFILIMGALAVGFGGARWGARLVGSLHAVVPELQHKIDQALLKDPTAAAIVPAMRATFPDDYRRYATTYAERLAPLTLDPAKFKDRSADVAHWFRDDTEKFARLHHSDIARSSNSDLYALARLRDQFIGMSLGDASLCEAGLSGRREHTDPRWNLPAPTNESATFGAFVAAELRAARDGIAQPHLRRTDGVNAQSQRDLRAELRRRLSEAEVSLTTDQQALAAADVTTRCRVLVAATQAVAALPQSEAAELTAYQYANAK